VDHLAGVFARVFGRVGAFFGECQIAAFADVGRGFAADLDPDLAAEGAARAAFRFGCGGVGDADPVAQTAAGVDRAGRDGRRRRQFARVFRNAERGELGFARRRMGFGDPQIPAEDRRRYSG
jgi:hypothetical protein